MRECGTENQTIMFDGGSKANSLVVNKKYCDRGDKGLKIGTQVNIDMLN